MFTEFDWIILNKILTEFKFVEHLRKILKTLNYFLVIYELISGIKVKSAFKKIGGKFKENSRKITQFRKKSCERLRKFLGNFTLNFGKVCRKSVEFQKKFWERLKAKILKL